ncbi:MAG: LexA family protein [Porticoccaceae bacterium]
MFSFIAKHETGTALALPLALMRLRAGFPSPAEDHIDRQLDLNEFILHPAATFYGRLEGDSMEPLIRDGDLLVVDRAISAKPGHVVVAVHAGEFTVKRLVQSGNRWLLTPDNPTYPVLECNEESEIWGVVQITLHWPSP